MHENRHKYVTKNCLFYVYENFKSSTIEGTKMWASFFSKMEKPNVQMDEQTDVEV